MLQAHRGECGAGSAIWVVCRAVKIRNPMAEKMDALENAAVELFNFLPESWTEFDFRGLSDEHGKALLQLRDAALVALELTFTVQFVGAEDKLKFTVQCSGSRWGQKAQEIVIPILRDTDSSDVKLTQVFGGERWMLRGEGIKARTEILRDPSPANVRRILDVGIFVAQCHCRLAGDPKLQRAPVPT